MQGCYTVYTISWQEAQSYSLENHQFRAFYLAPINFLVQTIKLNRREFNSAKRLQTAKAKRQSPSQLNSLTHRLCLNTGHYAGLDKISRCAHSGEQPCVLEERSRLCFH